jgi:hypothetical protein
MVCVSVLATPVEEPSWSVEPQDWLAAVRERWPEARVRLGGYPDEPTAAVALLPAAGGRLEVALDVDKQTVAFEPLLPDAIAEFLVWWAAHVPSYDPPVHLFVGGDADRSLPLTPEVTADEVRRFLAG